MGIALRNNRTRAECREARTKLFGPAAPAGPPSLIAKRPAEGRIVTIVITPPRLRGRRASIGQNHETRESVRPARHPAKGNHLVCVTTLKQELIAKIPSILRIMLQHDIPIAKTLQKDLLQKERAKTWRVKGRVRFYR